MSDELILANKAQSLAPSFMQGETDMGTELLSQFVLPPRVKVIQKMADSDVFGDFEFGDVVLMPQKLGLAGEGEPFYFVPLLFFPEWCTINPIQMKGNLPMIRERSLDIRSAIARKAQDATLRNAEPCPENKELRLSHVEYLTFICLVLRHETIAGLPIALSFSKAEHKHGSQLASLIKLRRAPLYGCIFEGKSSKGPPRKNAKGEWAGIDVTNPTSEGCPPPFVTNAAEFAQLKDMHLQMKSAYEQKLIQVEYDDAGDDAEVGVAEAEAKY